MSREIDYERLFDCLASIALTTSKPKLNPIDVYDRCQGVLGLPIESRKLLIEVWKRRKSEFPWHCPHR